MKAAVVHSIIVYTICTICGTDAQISSISRRLRRGLRHNEEFNANRSLQDEVGMSIPLHSETAPSAPTPAEEPIVDPLPVCIAQEEKDVLIDEKKTNYGGVTFMQYQDLEEYPNNPVEPYDWTDVVFINWKIGRVAALEKYLNLPDNLHITQLSMTESDTGDQDGEGHYLSFAIKRVEISTMNFIFPSTKQTIQGDWFVYVTDSTDDRDTSRPYFLNVGKEVYSYSTKSPIDIINSSTVQYAVSSNSIEIDAKSNGVVASIDVTSSEPRGLSSDFTLAFGKIFWANGIYSILGSNGSLSQAKVNYIDNQAVDASKTHWSIFLADTSSEHIFSFPQPLQLASEVWVNAWSYAQAVNTTPLTNRNAVYNSRIISRAMQVFNGSPTAQSVVKFEVTQTAPYYYMNFRIKDLEGLAKAIPLPQGLELAPIQFREHGPTEYILALNVYSVYGLGGLVAGNRAEWDVFVKEQGSTKPYFMIIDAQSSMDSLDPTNPHGHAASTRLQHEVIDGISTTLVETLDGHTFEATFPMPDPCPNDEISDICDPATLDVAAANDKVYWSNGIHDVGRWEVAAWKDSMSVVDVTSIQIQDNTVWSQYLEDVPLELVLFQNSQHYYFSPWYNVGEVEIC